MNLQVFRSSISPPLFYNKARDLLALLAFQMVQQQAVVNRKLASKSTVTKDRLCSQFCTHVG